MASDLPLSGMHVLVVEDEYFIASALVRDLKKAGAVTIGPSPTVSGALKLIPETTQIDVALLNFKLRDGTALPLTEELRRRGIPFIFITGNDEAVRALFPDALVHLKPANMPKLVLTLAAMIGERGSSE